MKKLFIFIGLFISLTSNAGNITLDEPQIHLIESNELDIQSQVYEESEANLDDDYFCRVCLTHYVPSVLDGTYIGFTACAGNMFTSCDTATEKANEKLLIKIAKIFEDL